MYQWNNPTFSKNVTYKENEDEEKNEEEEENCDEDLKELRSVDARILDELVRDNTTKQLDLSKLSRSRVTLSETKWVLDDETGNKGTKGRLKIKIASLQPMELHEEHESIIKILMNENEVCEYLKTEDLNGSTKNETASHALLNYFAMLGQPGETKLIDYYFVDALCQKGDINIVDVYKQGLMHEVARDWHVDVARFLFSRGILIDEQDIYGRTPLFVAAAANNVDMVKWLLDNNANINHKTLNGEGQYAIHYASKYDAVEALDLLISYKSSPILRDDQCRTPFFVAAEAAHARICSHFLDLEVPTSSYAANGISTIDEIVENLPAELADRALNQFHCVAQDNMSKVKIYLSSLGKKRARLLNNAKMLESLRMMNKEQKTVSTLNATIPASTLELIARKDYLDLISHPVIQQMIRIKESFYGHKYIYFNIVLNIIYTFLWTIAASFRISDIDDEVGVHPTVGETVFVLVITLIAQFIAFFFMHKLYKEYNARHQYVQDKIGIFELQQMKRKKFCHPRWPGDKDMLTKKQEAVSSLKDKFWEDGWVVLDVLSLFLATMYTILTILWFISERLHKEFIPHNTRTYCSAFFILVIWIRLNRCFKMHKAFGAFVAMLGECLVASYEIGFLFLEFFIPFGVTFWVLFGGQEGSGDNYSMLRDLVYQLYLLSIVGDYDFNTLKEIHHFAAELLVGLYLVSISIITINLYIALLSEAFSRVIENASNRADLEKALFFSDIERIFPETNREFEAYLNRFCSPLVIEKRDFCTSTGDENMRAVVSNSSRIVKALNSSMTKVSMTEKNMKRDMADLETKFRDFQEKFPEEKVRNLLKSFVEIIEYQSKPYVRVVKKTNDNIIKALRQIKHGGKYV